ncbi:MAG: nicotinate (nicotinamide) nucleotide adenylyltransferase [Saccharospirillum sp.]
MNKINRKPLMAIFGGTFDPFHCAHERLCHAVLAEPEVDQLRLIPCQIPALKGAASASAEQRLSMLQAWADGQNQGDRLVVDRQELDRPGPSFTVDTLKALRDAYPQWQPVFVMGADSFAALPRWEGVEKLTRLTHFWVFGRGHNRVTDTALPLRAVGSLEAFQQQSAGLWLAGPSSDSDLASSQLRRVSPGYWREDTPRVIFNYIQQHRLYQEL